MRLSIVQGYERDVGSRTTLRFVSHVSARWFRDDPQFAPGFAAAMETSKYVVLTTPREYGSGAEAAGILTRHFTRPSEMIPNHASTALYVATKASFINSLRQWRSLTNGSTAVTSTGYRALYYARRFCPSITMFGFINAERCSKNDGKRHPYPYHYYSSASKRLRLAGSNECDVYNDVVKLNRVIHRHDFVLEKRIFHQLALSGTPPIRFVRPSWNTGGG